MISICNMFCVYCMHGSVNLVVTILVTFVIIEQSQCFNFLPTHIIELSGLVAALYDS